MKTARIILYTLLIAALAALLLYGYRTEETSSLEVSEPVASPLETTAPPVEALRPAEGGTSEEQEAIQEPVQSLEERGDALLFESDALQGTPFDQAVVMPFE